MIFLYILAALFIAGYILFLNRWSGWQNDIRKQIQLYKELRSQLPDAHESNLTSRLIRLKIKSNSSESMRTFFDPIAIQSGLTLNTALFFMIEYDYIRNKGLNPTEPGPTNFLQKANEFINKTVKEEFPGGA